MDMSYKGWLSVGLKVLGAATLVNGLVQVVIQWGSLPSVWGMASSWLLVGSIALPLVTIAAGLYLLMGTRGLVDRVWSDGQEELDSAQVMFAVAMKIMGLVLAVQALPEVIQAIFNILFIFGVSPVWDTSAQNQFIYQKFLSMLLKLLLGCYLLFKGTWLQRVAFPPSNE